MPPKRDRPYAQFNFLVDLGTGDTDSVDAGFQECSNLGRPATLDEVDVQQRHFFLLRLCENPFAFPQPTLGSRKSLVKCLL